jgi:type 1 glutamine amidotransferase/nicotinamidase-related amidase
VLLCLAAACFAAGVDAEAPKDSPRPSTVGRDKDGGTLKLTERTRKEVGGLPGRWEVVEKPAEWDPAKVALIICDMWDKHHCDNATRRTGELAPRVNELAKSLRAKGALIIHAPSDTMKFYEGTPQRRRAQEAPKVAPPVEVDRTCPALPIDDSDGGCDDDPPHVVHMPPYPWTREHPAIEVGQDDAVTDKGDEVYNLLRRRGIEHVLLCGVHTNMCILNRKFAIKQLVKWGCDVALVRDLTDTMYNPKRPPYVPHARGTDLVVQFIEQYWCPTILSSEVLGDARPPRVVIVTAEQEYDAKDTLAAFAKKELEEKLGYKVTCINSDSTTDVPGLEALDEADLLILFMRRRTLPEEQLKKFQAYFEAGKPVVALRTSCHAFQNWLAFDGEVLGCHYANHYSNGLPATGKDGKDGKPPANGGGEAAMTHVRVEEKSAADPILRGVDKSFDSAGALYKVSPLAETAKPLLLGKWDDKPAEPVAWTNTHKGGRVFFTSLGHPKDFETSAFRTLLRNAVLWALDKPVATR